MGISNFNSVAKKKMFLGRKNTGGAFTRPSSPVGAFVFTSVLYIISIKQIH
jgi:hypothetical protein